MELSIIAAVGAENFAIGKAGKMCWHYPEDLAHFQKITTEIGCVVMGRKTWESIEKPLVGRLNIVISTTINALIHIPARRLNTQLRVVNSLKHLLTFIDLSKIEHLCIIGGSTLYSEAMQLDCCKTAYITRVPDIVLDADTFFPNQILNQFFTLKTAEHRGKLVFEVWERKK